MKVDSAKFEKLPADPPPGPWVMRVVLEGEGFEDRAAPLVASVGDINVDILRVSSDGAKAAGLLAEVPADGAQLRIGYLNDRELQATGISFHQA